MGFSHLLWPDSNHPPGPGPWGRADGGFGACTDAFEAFLILPLGQVQVGDQATQPAADREPNHGVDPENL